MTEWKTNLINDNEGIDALLRDTKTIAVLGIKPESHAGQAGHYVPAHMAQAGYEIIPVPVYYPEVTEILGLPVVRTLAAIGRPIDMVNVFRKPSDIPAHVDDILAAIRPVRRTARKIDERCTWTGISTSGLTRTIVMVRHAWREPGFPSLSSWTILRPASPRQRFFEVIRDFLTMPFRRASLTPPMLFAKRFWRSRHSL
jgi:predicted CoA-binding protein